jgi:hypothetical protein
MTHTVMIVLHAVAGLVAFVAGYMVVTPPSDEQRARRLLGVYLAALGLMIAFMLGAMVVHWQQLGIGQQLIFGGLFLLGLYMGWRALSARRLLQQRSEGWRLPYMEHVGFTLIALWEGFVIVLAIDLGAPGWLVVVLAVLGVVLGNRALHRAEARAGVLS